MTTAGSRVFASDSPPAGVDSEGTDENFTSASYSSGSAVTGAAFIAPTSGTVIVLWSCRINADTGGANHRALCSVQVASGAAIGSGSVVSAASDDSAIETPETASGGTIGQSRLSTCMFRVVSGLTAGSTYNAVVQFKGAVALSGNGTIFQRDVAVLPIA